MVPALLPLPWPTGSFKPWVHLCLHTLTSLKDEIIPVYRGGELNHAHPASSAAQPVHQALQAGVCLVSESGWVPGFGKSLCSRHSHHDRAQSLAASKPIHHQMSLTKYRVCGFYTWMDAKHVELSTRSLLPSWHSTSLEVICGCLFKVLKEVWVEKCSRLPLNLSPFTLSLLASKFCDNLLTDLVFFLSLRPRANLLHRVLRYT